MSPPELAKEILEPHYAREAIALLPGLSISDVRSMAPPAPDVEIEFDDGTRIGVECRRYGAAADKPDETI